MRRNEDLGVAEETDPLGRTVMSREHFGHVTRDMTRGHSNRISDEHFGHLISIDVVMCLL